MIERKTNWPLTIFLSIISAPILIMYLWLFIDSVSEINTDSIWPTTFTLRNWRFLVEEIPGHGSVWRALFNTIVFASSVVAIVVVLSSTAGYALSRLKFPFRPQFLGFVLLLHSFPSVTLIIS
ncbi:MAG: carbohydrate ABC transporter permease, partial [Alphaproteobacteria bacterium]